MELNHDIKFNDIPIEKDIGQPLQTFVDETILSDTVEAEGIIIQIIPLVLRINLITVIIDILDKENVIIYIYIYIIYIFLGESLFPIKPL